MRSTIWTISRRTPKKVQDKSINKRRWLQIKVQRGHRRACRTSVRLSFCLKSGQDVKTFPLWRPGHNRLAEEWMHGLSTGTEKMAVSNVSILVSLVQIMIVYCGCLKVMFHGTFRNDNFQRTTALQHCCYIASNGCNIVPTLQRCVALKIVVANRLV